LNKDSFLVDGISRRLRPTSVTFNVAVPSQGDCGGLESHCKAMEAIKGQAQGTMGSSYKWQSLGFEACSASRCKAIAHKTLPSSE
jgi:hypothetical protein